MLTLTIPPRRDPIARLTLIGCVVAVALAWVYGATQPQPATAQSDPPVVIVATPTLPMMQPTDAPALTLAAPTPQVIYVPGPTPEPQVIYVSVEAPPADVQPAYSPDTQPVEAAAALNDAYQTLPVLHCPCGYDASASQPAPSAAQLAQSAKRTR